MSKSKHLIDKRSKQNNSLPSLKAIVGTGITSSFRQTRTSMLSNLPQERISIDMNSKNQGGPVSLKSSTRIGRQIPLPIDTYGVNTLSIAGSIEVSQS